MPEPATSVPAPTTAPAATAPSADPNALGFTPDGKLRVRFHNQTVELDPENAIKNAQLGLAAGSLEEKRAKFQAEQKQYEQQLQIGKTIEGLAQNDKPTFERLRKVMAGAKLAEEVKPKDDLEDEIEDEPLTRPNGRHRVPTALEEQVKQLAATVDRTVRTLDQRDKESALNLALDSQAVFKANPEARELATKLARASVEAGEFETFDQAATAYAAQINRMAAAQLEAERRARETKAEIAAPRTPAPSAAIARLDPSEATYAALKDKGPGGLAAKLKDRVRQAMNPNP